MSCCCCRPSITWRAGNQLLPLPVCLTPPRCHRARNADRGDDGCCKVQMVCWARACRGAGCSDGMAKLALAGAVVGADRQQPHCVLSERGRDHKLWPCFLWREISHCHLSPPPVPFATAPHQPDRLAGRGTTSAQQHGGATHSSSSVPPDQRPFCVACWRARCACSPPSPPDVRWRPARPAAAGPPAPLSRAGGRAYGILAQCDAACVKQHVGTNNRMPATTRLPQASHPRFSSYLPCHKAQALVERTDAPPSSRGAACYPLPPRPIPPHQLPWQQAACFT
jgi:hypothetical protein